MPQTDPPTDSDSDTDDDVPTCDVRVRDCESDAAYSLTLTSDERLFREAELTLERVCCAEHLAWYRQEYVRARDYEMDVEQL